MPVRMPVWHGMGCVWAREGGYHVGISVDMDGGLDRLGSNN